VVWNGVLYIKKKQTNLTFKLIRTMKKLLFFVMIGAMFSACSLEEVEPNNSAQTVEDIDRSQPNH
jgi:hypothetical protein